MEKANILVSANIWNELSKLLNNIEYGELKKLTPEQIQQLESDVSYISHELGISLIEKIVTKNKDGVESLRNELSKLCADKDPYLLDDTPIRERLILRMQVMIELLNVFLLLHK